MHTSISIDKATRDRAAKRAQRENMPLAVVVRILLNEYADGRLGIGARTEMQVTAREIKVDAQTRRKMDGVIEAWDGRMAA